MVSGMNLDILKKAGKDPCGVYQKGVGSNAILHGGYLLNLPIYSIFHWLLLPDIIGSLMRFFISET